MDPLSRPTTACKGCEGEGEKTRERTEVGWWILITERDMSRKSYRTSARDQQGGEETYPDAHVTVRRACDAVVRDHGGAGELVDGANVVLCLSFCRHVSRERRRPKTRTVLGAAGLVQVPHDEVAVPRARQNLVAVICRDLSL